MTDDLEHKIARRMRRLADAAPVQPRRSRVIGGTRVRFAGTPGSALALISVFALLAVAIGVGGQIGRGGAAPFVTESQPPSTASPSVSPVPSGGIALAVAETLAGPHAPLASRLISASAGPFSDYAVGQSGPIAPNRLVWAVVFSSIATICPPSGSACLSPRPGTVTVVLDYYTGEFLASEGDYPNPG